MRIPGILPKPEASVRYSLITHESLRDKTLPMSIERLAPDIDGVSYFKPGRAEPQVFEVQFFRDSTGPISIYGCLPPKYADEACQKIREVARPAHVTRSLILGAKTGLGFALRLSVVALPLAVGLFFVSPIATAVIAAFTVCCATLAGIYTGVWHFRTEQKNFDLDRTINNWLSAFDFVRTGDWKHELFYEKGKRGENHSLKHVAAFSIAVREAGLKMPDEDVRISVFGVTIK